MTWPISWFAQETLWRLRIYGVSLVWVNPNQVRASTMEEAVGTLSTYISSRPNWPYALVQLYKGSSHTAPSQGQAFGHPTPGKAEESPYGQISQLEVCQLLSTRPQVIYPVGLKGNDKPVTTTLPEPLHSGASITTNKHPYMRIDIPPPPWRNQNVQLHQLMKQTPSQQPIYHKPPKHQESA